MNQEFKTPADFSASISASIEFGEMLTCREEDEYFTYSIDLNSLPK